MRSDANPEMSESDLEQTVGPIPGGPRKPLGPLLWVGDVAPVLSQAFVIKDVIATGSAVVIYGDSNSGKTFFALDMCLHVAAGNPWRGHRVEAGLVIYVAAEGGHGIRNRLVAYRKESPWAKGAPLAVLPQTVDLLDRNADTGPLIDLVKVAEETAGIGVAVIVLDTLARTMPGGNENAPDDMTAFIANVDRIRADTGAAALIIHHGGKDPTKGARGHSSLRAAADTEIHVEGTQGTRTATVTKQRDLPGGQVFGFDLVPVEIGIDPDDKTAVSSCVVAATDAPIQTRKGPRGQRQQDVLRMIEAEGRHGNLPMPSSEIVALARKRLGIGKSSAHAAVDGLARSGFIIATVGGMNLTAAADPVPASKSSKTVQMDDFGPGQASKKSKSPLGDGLLDAPLDAIADSRKGQAGNGKRPAERGQVRNRP